MPNADAPGAGVNAKCSRRTFSSRFTRYRFWLPVSVTRDATAAVTDRAQAWHEDRRFAATGGCGRGACVAEMVHKTPHGLLPVPCCINARRICFLAQTGAATGGELRCWTRPACAQDRSCKTVFSPQFREYRRNLTPVRTRFPDRNHKTTCPFCEQTTDRLQHPSVRTRKIFPGILGAESTREETLDMAEL